MLYGSIITVYFSENKTEQTNKIYVQSLNFLSLKFVARKVITRF
jgi:hypothetical protein